jgi:hypothetical protein
MIKMAETPRQYQGRILKSKRQFWDGIPITGYRSYCVYCGSINRVNKNWMSMTCGNCGRVGPALNDKEAKKEMLKNGVTKFWLW